MTKVTIMCMFLFIFVSIILPLHVQANIGDFDDHWKNREQQAKMNAAKAYDPNPQEACHTLNKQVHENYHETSNNNTRRGLGKYDGHCLAANPIDRCWRCDKHWSMNRQKLADCARGFGHKTTGGKKGRIYVVTDDSDGDLLNPKPGTLRHAVIQDGPLWITFKHGMVIRLSEELLVSSNKTLDGRGGHVHIAGGAGIMLQYVDNVIIHSVHIHDIKKGNGGLIRDSMSHFGFRTASDGDGISIFGSTNIWIDHVSMSNCMDGLIDAIEASTAITISNCHFTDHNDVMLFGARDGNTLDELMQVTIAFNHFGKRLIQRMPRCRYGFFHVVNNDYTHWEMYAIGGSQHPTIISQGNRFIAPPNLFAKEVTKREYAPYSEWKNWLWTSDEDIMLNGAFFNQSGDKTKKFAYTRQDVIKAKPGSYVKRLTRFAGALNCKEGEAC
ncbi:pectate lyase-like isoform X1 [Chenopodium quinoa]|uniref:pectate lyase-like isoform X1 n=1 Tax=Chenopodium quinoa TaxID=63459 RepID=UPI000B77B9F4|nr:pectate lyase-like isoform X1 [Chenopodium quinoa]